MWKLGGPQRVRGSTFLRQGREPGFNVCVDIASRLVYALGAPGCGGISSQNTGVVRVIKEKEHIREECHTRRQVLPKAVSSSSGSEKVSTGRKQSAGARLREDRTAWQEKVSE